MSGPSVETISSLADMIDLATSASRRGRDGMNRRTMWFRGHRSESYSLVPSVFRNVPLSERQRIERHLVHHFRGRAAIHLRDEIRYDDRARWLALMQHHRLPTRLLDWSRSPMVAVYFAVEHALPAFFDAPMTSTDAAAIWMLDPHGLNNFVSGGNDTVGALDSGVLHHLVADAFFTSDPPASDTELVVSAASSVEFDIRMFAQRGGFTIHSSDLDPLEAVKDFAPFLTKIVIPAAAIVRIAEQVDACGFREGDVYPDLDHLSAEIVRNSPLPQASLMRPFP